MLHAPRLRVALAVLLVMAAPAVVSAARHLKLVKSQPAANATLHRAPAQVQLWFSQVPQVTVTRLTLVPAAGKPVVLSPVTRADGANEPVVAPVPSGLAAGKWTLRWRTVAKDGHPVKGEIPFTIADVGSPEPLHALRGTRVDKSHDSLVTMHDGMRSDEALLFGAPSCDHRFAPDRGTTQCVWNTVAPGR